MPNPRDIALEINDAIGVAMDGDGKDLTVSTYERKEVPTAEDFKNSGPVEDSAIEDDYAYARSQLQIIIESGQEALQGALEVASATGNPEIYASVAQLMRETSETSDKLLTLQKRIKEVRMAEAKIRALAKPKAPEQGPSVTNNLFIGSTKDMIDMLRAARESDVIEGIAINVDE